MRIAYRENWQHFQLELVPVSQLVKSSARRNPATQSSCFLENQTLSLSTDRTAGFEFAPGSRKDPGSESNRDCDTLDHFRRTTTSRSRSNYPPTAVAGVADVVAVVVVVATWTGTKVDWFFAGNRRGHCAGWFRTWPRRRNSWKRDAVVSVSGAAAAVDEWQCPPGECSWSIFGNDNDDDVG